MHKHITTTALEIKNTMTTFSQNGIGIFRAAVALPKIFEIYTYNTYSLILIGRSPL
jgi:hypothetical protein